MTTPSPNVLIALLLSTIALRAEPLPLQPFVIDHLARQDSPADVSFLLGKNPAGQEGFVTVKEGHLVKGDGTRLRIWGVNLTGWARGSTNLPPKDQADPWAAALARVGINCVRFHFLDLPTRSPQDIADEPKRREAEASGKRFKMRPAGLIDSRRNDNQALDPEALDRLDFFVAALKRRGIYSNLNLNVGLQYKPGDNVPDSDVITLTKGFTYIGERMIELQ